VDNFKIIAGPCAIESYDQMNEVAKFLKDNGIEYLRGGAFKPRSSPYSFQGLGIKGMNILYLMKEKYDLKIVTELTDWNYHKYFADVDMLQLGARNMYNYALLEDIARHNYLWPEILLKRGLAAPIKDLLSSAEYIKKEGYENLILCERGVMRYGQEMRNMLDIAMVPYVKQTTDYKVIVDPSHACGRRSLIIPLCKAAKAVGADGIMVEVHPSPKDAKCDSEQQLSFSEFELLLKEIQ
jgi:3-deoxy-7-phosphoheptulonate synthase